MSELMPIWFCIVKQETLTQSGIYGYRILKAIACELGDSEALYKQYHTLIHEVLPGGYQQAMLFTREPEETPIKDKVNRDDELRQSILDLRDTVVLLERRLDQEVTWKDQLAEDNRILREKIGIPDSHFKFSQESKGVEEVRPPEYDW